MSQSENGLIGGRSFRGVGALFIKLAWGKNLEGVASSNAHAFAPHSSGRKEAFPPHGIWTRVRDRTNDGALCFPSYNKNNFNMRRKFPLMEMNAKEAGRYAYKAFLGGASRELVQRGSTIAVVKS